MKITNLLIILFVLTSCESKSQEKITQLSQEDRNIVKNLISANFKIESIEKIDSSQNSKKIYYYDNNFSNTRLKSSTYNKDGKLETELEYISSNQDFLNLVGERKHIYTKESEKIESQIWRNNKKYGSQIENKFYDKEGRIVEEIAESKLGKPQSSTTRKNTYKYKIDPTKNIATTCKEEYQSNYAPNSFEYCENYHYIDGKITTKKINNQYQYDSKNRLIKEVSFNKNKNPYFEDLYIYDDKNKTMEFQRYRFDNSRILARKEQTFYNKHGNVEKYIIFKLNKDDKFEQENIFYSVYDNSNKKILEIKLKSKIFIEKGPSLPK